jgi:hypothetical protein
MKNNKVLIIVLVVLLVIAVFIILNGSITGNVIKVNDIRTGKYQVYTKAEIDNLLATSWTYTLNEGETKTVTMSDGSHKISLSFISASEAILVVDGTSTGKLAAGSSILLSNNFKLYVKSIDYQDYVGGKKSVTILITKTSGTISADVLDILGNCVQVEPNQAVNRWCGQTCNAIGKKTIGFSTYVSYVAIKKDGQRDLHQVPLFGWGDDQPMPSCGDGTAIGCGLAGDAEELMELENGFNATTITIDKVGVYSRCICC